MAHRDEPSTEGALREVARSPALDLIEVQIARDVLAGETRKLGPAPAVAVAK